MEALRFTGSGSEYFKIWIVNVLLTILTLGLYYPWAKVRNRRYFYANSTLSDRNFEYHATGKQLFLGFLIAMVFFILYNILGQINPFLGLAALLVLFIAIPWLIWRSLMFNMRVSSFSNVHFAFVGKLGTAYINFFVYPFLLILAFYAGPIIAAVAMPRLMYNENMSWIGSLIPIFMIASMVIAFYLFAVIKKRNTEFVINGTRYGQGIFEAKLKAKKFMMINLKGIGVMLAIVIPLIAVGSVLGVGEFMTPFTNPESMQRGELPDGFGMFFALIYFVLIIVSILVMSYVHTRQRTYIYENTKLDDKIAFASTLKAKSFAWIMLSNFFLVIITFGLAFPWAKVRMARLMLENTLVETEEGFDEYISQKQAEVSSLGEQIGDAFDVDIDVAF